MVAGNPKSGNGLASAVRRSAAIATISYKKSRKITWDKDREDIS